MEETIELRELIETIWKGKWLITAITAFFMLAAAIISWFFLPEQYESKAIVQVASGIQDTGIMSNYVASEFTPIIFSERIKNKQVMDEALLENGIEDKFNSSSLSTTVQANSNLVELKYTSADAEKAHNYLEFFINKAKEQMSLSVNRTLNQLEETYTTKSNQLSVEIKSLVDQYNKVIVENELPEILVLQTMVNSQIILSLNDEQTKEIANIDGALQNELMQLQTQIASKSAEYRIVLDQYQSVKTGLDSFKPEPFIRTISKPTLSENPILPNKKLNVAIAMVIGLMVGIGIAFFRQYWKNTALAK